MDFYIGSTNYYWGSTALPSNQWVHVAVVRDSNNDIKIYQDGVQGSGTVNSSATLSSISALRIGYNVGNIGWWPGKITQFRYQIPQGIQVLLLLPYSFHFRLKY